MSRYLLFVILMGTVLQAAEAQEEYAISRIQTKLLKNANVVKRSESFRLEVLSMTKMRFRKSYAITILNEAGNDYASFYAHYDKLRTVESIEGRLYDAVGKKIRSLKKSDIRDYSAVSDISFFEDSRVKAHDFYYKAYPYTVEYETVIEFNNTYLFPTWIPQSFDGCAVEKSMYQIVCPADFSFRFKAYNYSGEPLIEQKENKKTYTWKIGNIEPAVAEYAAPEPVTLTTSVYFSPDKFELEGYKGSMASWAELGQFQIQLNKGRDKLPETVKQQVHKLVDGIVDVKERIRILYEYMQKNTRYISIQLGIGGLQPFEASFVASKAYGDCKALSNYMYALLKEVNIKSCYTQIKAGRGEHFFMPDFPSDQFNHIILCVPLQNDTVWLECTSQTLSAGYLGRHTDDRYALLIDGDNGKLVRTPKYAAGENLQHRNIKAKMDDNGGLQLNTSTHYTGLQQDDLHGLINNLSKEKVKEYLQEQLDLPSYDIGAFTYKEVKGKLPSVYESIDITVNNYASITGKRLFITPNIMTKSYRKLTANEDRKHDIVFNTEYIDVDTVEIELPKGYEPESVSQPVSISSQFGKYSNTVKLSGNKLIYYRSIVQYSGRFPAKEYADLVKYSDAVYKADRSKVVLVKNEQALKGF